MLGQAVRQRSAVFVAFTCCIISATKESSVYEVICYVVVVLIIGMCFLTQIDCVEK